jgi:thiosulfate/3-mercaptopyruvate sulfurtransferase
MRYIVEPAWLYERLNDPNIVIADCRFVLGQPDTGRQGYEAGHIPGAVYADLERDLSGPIGPHGGRHPLPEPEKMAAAFGRMGIDGTKTVVAYDEQGGAMASRLWWMLRYAGHDNVHVLDGGFGAWKAAGYPTSTEPAQVRETTFELALQPDMLLTVEDVRARLGQSSTKLVDSREPRRYLGLEEPIDPVAGHIPGAVNRFWKDALDESGRWKPAEDQRERFAGWDRDEEIVVYCGSGVTACPNVLALTEAGFRNVKLYGGSWSDWISYKDNPIVTGEEK